MQSGKFVITPSDDTTLIDSQKKGGKFHACLLAELIHDVSQPCGPRVFLLFFFSDAGHFFFAMTCRTLIRKTQKGKKIPCTS